MTGAIHNIALGERNARMIVTHPNDHLQSNWKRGRFYEIRLIKYVLSNYSGGTWIDCGANVGNHSVAFALWGCDRLVSIEPVPKLAALLDSNLALNKVRDKTLVVVQALDDRYGSCTMTHFGPKRFRGMNKVALGAQTETTTLDRLVTKHKLKDIRLIKMDVEFRELEVLRGARKLLLRDAPAIFVELTGDGHFEAAEGYLADLGYDWTGREFGASPVCEFVARE